MKRCWRIRLIVLLTFIVWSALTCFFVQTQLREPIMRWRVERLIRAIAEKNPNVSLAKMKEGEDCLFVGWRIILLDLSCQDIYDLSPLEGLPLNSLFLRGTKISDLSSLKGMPLTSLNISGTNVKELDPLKGMPLECLNLTGCPISDLTPLNEARLESISLSCCSAEDLTPLKEMPLVEFILHGTLAEKKPLPKWLIEKGCEIYFVEDFPW